MLTTSPAFKENARRAIADAGLQKALAFSRPQFMARRAAAIAALPSLNGCARSGATSRTTRCEISTSTSRLRGRVRRPAAGALVRNRR